MRAKAPRRHRTVSDSFMVTGPGIRKQAVNSRTITGPFEGTLKHAVKRVKRKLCAVDRVRGPGGDERRSFKGSYGGMEWF